MIEHCGLVGFRSPPPGAPVGAIDRLIYLGDDQQGVALEVMAVELRGDELLVVIPG